LLNERLGQNAHHRYVFQDFTKTVVLISSFNHKIRLAEDIKQMKEQLSEAGDSLKAATQKQQEATEKAAKIEKQMAKGEGKTKTTTKKEIRL